jgi:NAD(P)-dependent dehydrogenase (short-subunit alcohol dehydrogenase family)
VDGIHADPAFTGAENKVCLITGGTSGVGRAAACGLAFAGATVLILSRSSDRARETAAKIGRRTGNTRCFGYGCDLGDFKAVRRFAEKIAADHPRIHVLSNNAAVLPMRRRMLNNGVESIFGINYLGHFLLTTSLLATLKRSAPSRVITVAGDPWVFRFGRLPLNDLIDPRCYNPFLMTLRAAKAKVLFALELARRLEGTGVVSIPFHPGIIKTGLTRDLPRPVRWFTDIGQRVFSSRCDACGHLALAPEIAESNGTFFNKKRPVRFKPFYDPVHEGGRLWAKSLEWTA